jgi:exonuclease VII small subunit
MDNEILEELKQLFFNEKAYREEFRRKRQELENLVQPITNHVEKSCKFWEQNLQGLEEVVVVMEDGLAYKIVKPKKEVCSFESNLPFGIDFTECKVLRLDS